jgi:hypothetical protein
MRENVSLSEVTIFHGGILEYNELGYFLPSAKFLQKEEGDADNIVTLLLKFR